MLDLERKRATVARLRWRVEDGWSIKIWSDSLLHKPHFFLVSMVILFLQNSMLLEDLIDKEVGVLKLSVLLNGKLVPRQPT